MRLADRIVDILYCLQTGGGSLGVTEVSQKVALPKSTTHRLLQALENRSLVAQDVASQRYTLGLALVAMASSVLQKKGLVLAPAQGPMERLRALSEETVCLHVPSGLERVCIRQVEGPHPVRYTAEIGKPMPLYSGASGKLLLAHMPERIVVQVIQMTGLRPFTPHTIARPPLLMSELETIRSQGYSTSIEETTPLGSALAAPVRDREGQVIACVTVYGPRARLSEERMRQLLPHLLDTAREISLAIAPARPTAAQAEFAVDGAEHPVAS